LYETVPPLVWPGAIAIAFDFRVSEEGVATREEGLADAAPPYAIHTTTRGTIATVRRHPMGASMSDKLDDNAFFMM